MAEKDVSSGVGIKLGDCNKDVRMRSRRCSSWTWANVCG